MEQVVYFILAVGTDFVKIGVARDIDERLDGLATACPHELRVLGTVPGGPAKERHLHADLHCERVRGEWFRGPLTRFVVAQELGGKWRTLVAGARAKNRKVIRIRRAYQSTGGARPGRPAGASTRVLSIEARGLGEGRLRLRYLLAGVRHSASFPNMDALVAFAATLGLERDEKITRSVTEPGIRMVLMGAANKERR